MSAFVIDASVTLAWCFHDEATKETALLLDRLVKTEAFVPPIWSLEIGNVLLGAVRKKRISFADLQEFVGILEALPIIVDEHSVTRGYHDILFLASSHQLTTYDASYLECAMRLGLPLATLDKPLRKIAKDLGITLLS